MTDLEKAVEATVKAVETELSGYTVYSVYLTGSRYYGLERKDSDYDLKVYVRPDAFNLLFAEKLLSKRVEVNKNMVDNVEVKDVRFLAKQFGALNASSLHLLDAPVYGKLFGGSSSSHYFAATNSLKYGKKNLALSLVGRAKQALEKDNTVKTNLSAKYFALLANAVVNDDFTVNTVQNFKKNGFANNLKVYTEKPFTFKESNTYERYLEVLYQRAMKMPNDPDRTDFYVSLQKYLQGSVFKNVK